MQSADGRFNKARFAHCKWVGYWVESLCSGLAWKLKKKINFGYDLSGFLKMSEGVFNVTAVRKIANSL